MGINPKLILISKVFNKLTLTQLSVRNKTEKKRLLWKKNAFVI